MRYAVEVMVHRLGWYASEWTGFSQVQEDSIRNLFAPAGVALRFEAGSEIPGEPGDVAPGSFGESYLDLADRLAADRQAQDGTPRCHLILGFRAPKISFGVDDPVRQGEMFSTVGRGVAAVYTANTGSGELGRVETTQSAAHEIGHMLNLVHRLRQAGDPGALRTSMMPHFQRGWVDVAALVEAWNASDSEPGQIGLPAYPPDAHGYRLGLYPLEAAGRRWLLQDGDMNGVLPWASGYRFNDDPLFGLPGFDVSPPLIADLALSLEPEPCLHCRGGPLLLRLRLENHGLQAVALPSVLAPDYGSLRVEFEDIDGRIGFYEPPRVACGGRLRALAPGDYLDETLVLMDGPAGPILPRPGRFRVRATMSRYHVDTEVEVKEAPEPELTDPNLQTFLAKGGRGGGRRERTRVDRLLRSGTLPPAVLATLALIRARHVGSRARRNELLHIAEAPEVPKPLRFCAGLSRVAGATSTKERVEQVHLLSSCFPERASELQSTLPRTSMRRHTRTCTALLAPH
jgi:hypothetical protein